MYVFLNKWIDPDKLFNDMSVTQNKSQSCRCEMTSQALYKPICWQDRGHFVLFLDKASVCLKLSKFLSCLRRHWDEQDADTQTVLNSIFLPLHQSVFLSVCLFDDPAVFLNNSPSPRSSHNARLQCLAPFHLPCERVSADKW